MVNQLVPKDPKRAETVIAFDHDRYRRRDRSPRRHGIGTLFGVITLRRLRYEPWDAGVGLTCIFSLELRLGIIAGKATPALACRIGAWTAQYTQETVRSLLDTEHSVAWSVETLRDVVAGLSEQVAAFGPAAGVPRC